MTKTFWAGLLLLTGILLSIFIVFQPVYFILFLAAIIFLVIVFWKTEESLLALVFYLPFQIAFNVSKGIDLASSRVIIVILFLAWVIKSLAKKTLVIPDKLISGFIIVFLGLAILSAFFSINQERSAIRLLYFLNIIPTYFIFAAYFNSIPKIIKLIRALLASAVIIAVIGIIQFFGQFVFGVDKIIGFLSKNVAPVFYGESFSHAILANPSWLVNIGGQTYLRAISLFPDMHMFAIYLGLVIPLALSLFLFSGYLSYTIRIKSLLLFINLILSFSLLATFSRSGYVGAFFGIFAVVAVGWKFFDKRIKLMIIALAFVTIVLGLNSSGLFTSRFLSTFDLSEGSNSERIVNWYQGLRIIGDYPVTGVGVGAYSAAISPIAPVKSVISPHSTYLGIAAEMGLIALLVWIMLLVVTMKNLFTIFFSKNNTSKEAKIIALGLLGSFVWFLIQSVFDIAIYSPVVFVVLMIYFAVSVNLGEEKNIAKNI